MKSLNYRHESEVSIPTCKVCPIEQKNGKLAMNAGYAKASPKAAKGKPPNSVTHLPKEQQDPNTQGTGERSVNLRNNKGPREDSATPSFGNFIAQNDLGPAFTIETLDQLEKALNILPPTQVELSSNTV